MLTWTCHGTWLPGDARGWVDSSNNAYGTSMGKPDAALQARACAIATGTGQFLTDAERELVDAAIREHCAFRVWELLALNVRTNHVHVVLRAATHRPEIVIGQLKSRATLALREAGLRDTNARVWAREGSTRYLYFEEAVSGAVKYVRDGQ